jgi:hypothetical protein
MLRAAGIGLRVCIVRGKAGLEVCELAQALSRCGYAWNSRLGTATPRVYAFFFSSAVACGEVGKAVIAVETLYRESDDTAIAQDLENSWCKRVAVELARTPRGWRRWLPFWVWQRKLERRMARAGVFDAAGYLFRYPDVRAAPDSAIYHYLAHGMAEGRDGSAYVPAHDVAEAQDSAVDATAHDIVEAQDSFVDATTHDIVEAQDSSVDATTHDIVEAQDSSVDAPDSPSVGLDLDAIPAILASGLFDARWYTKQYGVEGTEQELVEDFLKASSQNTPREPGPLFSCEFYGLAHPETLVINALVHYVRYGMREGRRAFQPTAADAFMNQASEQPAYTLRDFLRPDWPVIVLYWSDGNFFFTDIAHYVAETLTGAGFEVQLRDEHRDLDLECTEIVVVAPHEYCVHGPGAAFTPEIASRVVHVNLEQWHTSWFSLALDKMLTSRKALDINPLSARGLSRLGIKTGFLPLLPRAGGVFDFGQEPPSKQLTRLRAVKPLTYPRKVLERPYDILFVGYLNQRRAQALAELGHVLSDHDCFLHSPRFTGPITPDSPNMIGSRDLAQIAQNTKVLLNIHQGESHYFEWHRLVVSGIAQGCVPLTEPCAPIGIVEPGKHYIEATLEEMPERIAWLLGTTQGLREIERIHKNGRELMTALGEQMMGHLS